MKYLRMGILVCAVLLVSSMAFGQNQYYAVTGGSTPDAPQLTVIDISADPPAVAGQLDVAFPVGGVVIDNTTVYATLFGTPTSPANSMIIADISDPTAPSLITQIDDVCGTTPEANGPAAIALTKDRAFAYISCLGNPLSRPGQWVAKLDTEMQQIVNRIQVPFSGPFAVLVHPNGQEIWVTTYGPALGPHPDKIVRIKTADDTLMDPITTPGTGPTGGAFCESGGYAFVSVNDPKQVAKISLTGQIMTSFGVGAGTVGVAFTSDCATAYAAGYGNLGIQDNKLVRIRTSDNFVETVAIDSGRFAGPFNVAVPSDNSLLVITMFGGLFSPGHTVKVLKRDTLDLLGEVEVGPSPSGIDITPPVTP